MQSLTDRPPGFAALTFEITPSAEEVYFVCFPAGFDRAFLRYMTCMTDSACGVFDDAQFRITACGTSFEAISRFTAGRQKFFFKKNKKIEKRVDKPCKI